LGVTRSPVIRLWDILDLSSASGFGKKYAKGVASSADNSHFIRRRAV